MLATQRRNHFKLDCNRRWQGTHFDRGSRRIRFSGACEIFRVNAVVDGKILFHVGEKDRDVDDVLPGRSRVFEHEPHIFKHGAALRFDVVTDDIAGGIERDAGNFFASSDSRPNAR